MKNIKFALSTLIVATLWISSCNKDEQTVAPPDPENEIITTVKLTAINLADTTDIVTAQWKDLTPNDGNPDTSSALLLLKENAVYNVSVSFLDETKTPAEDITTEVGDRADYHLICYTVSSGLNLAVQRTDMDSKSRELGLKSTMTTTTASNGQIEVALHHQPTDKNGVDCSRGSTDVDVFFRISVQ